MAESSKTPLEASVWLNVLVPSLHTWYICTFPFQEGLGRPGETSILITERGVLIQVIDPMHGLVPTQGSLTVRPGRPA